MTSPRSAPADRARAVIAGIGSCLPPLVVTNAQVVARGNLDTTDEWITSRTGIHRRRLAGPTVSTGDLATAAARAAIDSTGSPGPRPDLLLLVTTTPDRPCPATAPDVAHRLGLGTVPAFDLSAVCSGFLYGLATASALLRSGTCRAPLVVAAEKYSTIVDPFDRDTAPLFGDGAAAVALRLGDATEPGALLETDWGSDGGGCDLITVAAGGSRPPPPTLPDAGTATSGCADARSTPTPYAAWPPLPRRSSPRPAGGPRMSRPSSGTRPISGSWTPSPTASASAAAPFRQHPRRRQHRGRLRTARPRGRRRPTRLRPGRPHPAHRLRRRPHLGVRDPAVAGRTPEDGRPRNPPVAPRPPGGQPTVNPVREHLVTLLTEKFEAPPGSIDDDATLEDLDLDSLARVELVFSLQDHWGVPLDDDQDSTADVTVGRLVERIRTLLAQSAQQPDTSDTSASDTSDTSDTSE